MPETRRKPPEKKTCENCWFNKHYPWVCKPEEKAAKTCLDWKSRNA